MPRRSTVRAAAKRAGYRSGFEHSIARAARKSRIKFAYEPAEGRVTWIPKAKTYTPDFVLPNGVIVEAKGRLTVHDRTKHMLIKQQHPELDIRFVFQYNNPITKGSKTRYTDWADKNGFLWAMNEIPREWAREKKK
jgi:hypothetical protein